MYYDYLKIRFPLFNLLYLQHLNYGGFFVYIGVFRHIGYHPLPLIAVPHKPKLLNHRHHEASRIYVSTLTVRREEMWWRQGCANQICVIYL